MNLFFTDGHKEGEKHEISPPGISIGRELDNDIILELEGASRYHAKLFLKDSIWHLKDLGSTNGTKLNGTAITQNAEVKLTEGDQIRIGQQTMLFAETLNEKKTESSPIIKSPDNPEDLNAEPWAVTVSNAEPSSTPPPEEQTEKTEDKNEHKSSFLNFFDKKDEDVTATTPLTDDVDFFGKQNNKDGTNEKKSSKKYHAGLLFYVAVVGAAVILIAGFLILEQSKTAKTLSPTTKKTRKRAQLLLLYEKQVTSSNPKHNIFRFLMEIKDGTVTITRDDLQAGLKDQLSRKITPEQQLELEEQLQETDFMSAKQGQSGIARDGEDRFQKLTIAYGKEMNSITVKNTSPPRSFDSATKTVEDFSENILNIPAISLTPEERREDGMNSFRQGKQLFDNYRAQDKNLFQAIKHFTLAVENLAAFQPEPPEYKEAYKLKNESTRILQLQIRAHGRNAKRYIQLKEYSQAKDEYMSIMAKTAPGSKPYNTSRQKVINLEPLIRKKR
jgi:pSer/pThr/pTyr-binding forkhead associated (FHA) protein